MKDLPTVEYDWQKIVGKRARYNIEKWGLQDVTILALAIAEECGELAQAILQSEHEGQPRLRIADEALDLAALCLQMELRLQEDGVYEPLVRVEGMKP